jgi:hypothetical protein
LEETYQESRMTTSSPSFTGVRIANKADEDAIYSLLLMMHRENGLFSISDNKVRETMGRGTKQEGGIIGVVDGPEGIQATIGLTITQAWYSDDWFLNELWSFVHPAHRKDGHAPKLLNFSKWCSDNMFLPLLIEMVSNKRTEAKMRLIKRSVPYGGAFFIYNNGASEPQKASAVKS